MVEFGRIGPVTRPLFISGARDEKGRPGKEAARLVIR